MEKIKFIKALTVLSLPFMLMINCSTEKIKTGENASKIQDEETLMGAYTKYRSVSSEEKNLFSNTYKGEKDLTPLKVATQVVAGTNYSFICMDKNGIEYEVVIYEPLPGQGNPEVSSINKK